MEMVFTVDLLRLLFHYFFTDCCWAHPGPVPLPGPPPTVDSTFIPHFHRPARVDPNSWRWRAPNQISWEDDVAAQIVAADADVVAAAAETVAAVGGDCGCDVAADHWVHCVFGRAEET